MGEKILYMFPGQGSQSVGMRNSLELTDEMKELFNTADEMLGFPLSSVIDNGPDEELTRTSNTQPALLVMGIAFSRAVDARGHKPAAVMGHSLGEYTALVYSGAISFTDAVALVRKRGELMEKAATDTPGKMAAIIKPDLPRLESVLEGCRTAGVIEITNFNSPIQVVLSGENSPVDEAMRIINEERIGRAVELNVSAPFHSSLMKPIAEEYRMHLDGIDIKAPAVEFIDNVSGGIEANPDNIREKLVQQLYCPVQWEKSVHTAADSGITSFIECGPGNVLSGLVKRIVRNHAVIAGEDLFKDS